MNVDEVYCALRSGGPMTAVEIAHARLLPLNHVRMALDHLMDRGQVVPVRSDAPLYQIAPPSVPRRSSREVAAWSGRTDLIFPEGLR